MSHNAVDFLQKILRRDFWDLVDGVPEEMPNFTIRLLDKSFLLLGFIRSGFLSYPTRSKTEVETMVVFPVSSCDLVEFLLDISVREDLRKRDGSLGLFNNIA